MAFYVNLFFDLPRNLGDQRNTLFFRGFFFACFKQKVKTADAVNGSLITMRPMALASEIRW